MPFIAWDKSAQQRVDITKFSDPRADLKRGEIVCPICSTEMVVVAGKIITPHFRHKSLADCLYTEYQAGESDQHRMAKLWLRKHLEEESGFNVPVELEYHISDANRIADVAQIFPTGWVVVHEIQLASITTEKLEERTRDYLEAGCDAIWYLGRDADTPANRTWCERYQGFVAELQFEVKDIENQVCVYTSESDLSTHRKVLST